MEQEFLSHLLRHKEYDQVEVEMQLYENCNLSCTFCSQDHKASLEQASWNSLEKKWALADAYVESHAGSHFKFNLMGGELFQDKFNEDHYENLFSLCEKLNSSATQKGKTAQFMFTTNLIFANRKPVERLLARVADLGVNVQLATSFDFSGRTWSHSQKDLFKNNVEHFKKHIRLVGVVLHRPAIDVMVNRVDELFDWLYRHVPIVFEYYIPDLNHQDYFAPSDDDNLRAWLYLARHYPEVQPVKRWLTEKYNEVKCCSINRLTILANNTVSACRYFPYKPEDFKTDLDKHSIAGMAIKFIQDQGCQTCENFNRCGLHCFVQADRKNRKANEQCFLNNFFKQTNELQN
jgi:hypothetical protein